jgi:restriction system protein
LSLYLKAKSQNNMSRRKSGLLEDVVVIATKLPWWVGVGLAVILYLVLHQFASIQITAPSAAKDIGTSAGTTIVKIGATILQYVFPITLLMGSIGSIIGRRKRNTLHQGATDASALEAMSWRDFELLVGEFFRRLGFTVEETGGGGADGGIDLIAMHGTDRYVVQCKKWKARQVGVSTVRELYGVMVAEGAAGAFVVTSGVFTAEAKKFVEGREIELIAVEELLKLIAEQHAAVVEELLPASESPACPQCNSSMVRRLARKGAQAGNSFWGCSIYPKCRGTRPA